MPRTYKKPDSAIEQEWIALTGADGRGQRNPYAPWSVYVPPARPTPHRTPLKPPRTPPVQQYGTIKFTPNRALPASRAKGGLKLFLKVVMYAVLSFFGLILAVSILAAIIAP
ncbi:hypothetical protein [Methyloligella solikamskensis]|uniref:Uncharacterized protein n=1 Tax=Methyloligella solikamskensis TaxID=1177756 RepID=A0ABW3J736_9HYPH